MMKVLIFKETLLPPSETFIKAQVATLEKFSGILAGLERALPSLSFDTRAVFLSDLGPRLSALLAKLYRRTGIAPRFHQRLRAFNPDIVHAHFASGGRTALAVSKALNRPLVVTLHGSDITEGEQRGRHDALAEGTAMFICVSEFIRRCALEAGLPEEKLRVHHIGTDLSVFQPSSNIPRGMDVLFVGRLVEKKGCEYVIRAMQEVQAAYPDSELRIIGDGPLRSSLQALARELKVNCRFAGFQPAEVVSAEMQRARVFCVPSLTAANGDSEGLGMVFIEAQVMGLPVVSTLHGGIPEAVLDGVTGLLCPEREHVQLAHSILRLLSDDALWERFHKSCLELVADRFDLRRQTRLLEDLYEEVIHANRTSPAIAEQVSSPAVK